MGLLSKALSFLMFWRKRDTPKSKVLDVRADTELLSLVQQPAIQQELGLTADQIGQIDILIRDARKQHRQRFQALKRMPVEKQRKGKSRLRKEVARTAIEILEQSNVLSAEQQKRLQQINWQNLGAKAFLDSRLRKSLRLTRRQEDSIVEILNDIGQAVRQESNQINKGPLSNDQKKKLNTMKDEAFQVLLGKLSNDQTRVWSDIVGKRVSSELEVEVDSTQV